MTKPTLGGEEKPIMENTLSYILGLEPYLPIYSSSSSLEISCENVPPVIVDDPIDDMVSKLANINSAAVIDSSSNVLILIDDDDDFVRNAAANLRQQPIIVEDNQTVNKSIFSIIIFNKP
jgi:hypothetical protein